jgi:hypothetical protein
VTEMSLSDSRAYWFCVMLIPVGQTEFFCLLLPLAYHCVWSVLLSASLMYRSKFTSIMYQQTSLVALVVCMAVFLACTLASDFL